MSERAATVGVDFGTTNSSIAVVLPDAACELARFPFLDSGTDAYRSLLYFEQLPPSKASRRPSVLDRAGRDRALPCRGRQGPADPVAEVLSRPAAASRAPSCFGRKRRLEELIAAFSRDLRAGGRHAVSARHSSRDGRPPGPLRRRRHRRGQSVRRGQRLARRVSRRRVRVTSRSSSSLSARRTTTSPRSITMN